MCVMSLGRLWVCVGRFWVCGGCGCAWRGEIVAVRDELKADMSSGFARMDRRFDNLTAGLVALAESVGQVKGRTEVLATAD